MNKLDDISAKNENGENISSLFDKKMTDLLHCYYYNKEKFTFKYLDCNGETKVFSLKEKIEFFNKKLKIEFTTKKRKKPDDNLENEILSKYGKELNLDEDKIKVLKKCIHEIYEKKDEDYKYLENRLEKYLNKYYGWNQKIIKLIKIN